MKNDKIPVLGHTTKAERVYSALKRLIITGDLPPGEPINQGQLAGQLGVSTTPLREAMRSLEKEGWVISIGHGDLAVRAIERAEMAEVYSIKTLLELEGVRQAAENRTDEDIEVMRSALTTAQGDHDTEAQYFHAARSVHRAIYLASHNSVLIELLDKLWERYERHQIVLKDLLESHTVQDEHAPVVDAVIDRDGARASALLSLHLAQASSRVDYSNNTPSTVLDNA